MPHDYPTTDMNQHNLQSLDLPSINAAEQAVLKTIKDKVIEWECMMHHAIQQKDPDLLSANAYKAWAIAGDLLRHSISIAISELFLEVLRSRTTIFPALQPNSNDD